MVQELISWEEAEWTRQELGMSVADFARLIGLPTSRVHAGRLHPANCLPFDSGVLLQLAVNQIEQDERGRWSRRSA